MGKKKMLRKDEFRLDLSPSHQGIHNEAHPAYITARKGHRFRANTITHAKTVDNVETLDVGENPNKQSKDKRKTRLSPPFGKEIKCLAKKNFLIIDLANSLKRKLGSIIINLNKKRTQPVMRFHN